MPISTRRSLRHDLQLEQLIILCVPQSHTQDDVEELPTDLTKLSSADPSHAPPGAGTWECPQCSLRNARSRRTCLLCRERNPAPLTRHRPGKIFSVESLLAKRTARYRLPPTVMNYYAAPQAPEVYTELTHQGSPLMILHCVASPGTGDRSISFGGKATMRLLTLGKTKGKSTTLR